MSEGENIVPDSDDRPNDDLHGHGDLHGDLRDDLDCDLRRDLRRDLQRDLHRDMTASYSEISSCDPEPEIEAAVALATPSRPDSLTCDAKPLDLDGRVSHDGDMTHFVADDLEYKIKISSPVTKESPLSLQRSATPASLYRQLLTPQIGQVDVTVLNDLEYEARRIASSVDSLTEQLAGVLHCVSSLTAAGVHVYGAAVARTCDALDRNIRAMYTVLARGEEVSRAMAPAQAHAARLQEIRRLLHIMESTL